jgi:hypothetical protein
MPHFPRLPGSRFAPLARAAALGALVAGCGGGASAADAGADATSGTETPVPARFSELYRDYFGPTGVASCAGDGACHGSAHQDGALASGYVCGDTASACRASIVRAGLVSREGAALVEATRLYQILRKPDGRFGSMPKRPETLTFSKEDMARIGSWIDAGAPDD